MSVPLVGFGLRLFLAAQVGPVTLLIARTVLRGRRAVAVGLAMAGAVAFVDLLYATLGLAGAGQLLMTEGLRIPLGLVSAAILVLIGARTIWLGFRARTGAEFDDEVSTPRHACATAIADTALKPLTIALWTVSFPAAAASTAHSFDQAGALLVGVAVGTLTWFCGFGAAVALARRRVGPMLLAAVDIGAGSGLVAFGGLLGYRTVKDRGPW